VSITRIKKPGEKRRKELSREAKKLLEVLDEIDKHGHFDTNVPWEWIDWEEVEFKNDDDYTKFIHEEVPEAIREVAKEIGAKAYVYHLGYDVSGANYIVRLDRRGKKYTLYVGHYSEEDIFEKGRFTLLIVEGEKGWHGSSVYYHAV